MSSFEYLHTSDIAGNPKSEFGIEETPYLYVSLPRDGSAFVASWWLSPEVISYFDGGGIFEQREKIISIDIWDGIKETGRWNINALYFFPDNGKTGSGTVFFDVIPEPGTIILFFAGIFLLVGKSFSERIS
ncbi:MAG: PEP-CTERM sorting domain-containing protein [bacterium]|nr:PEP-CTERM sorting domain-containing protein [bacterium]